MTTLRSVLHPAAALGSESLAGLFNYASTYRIANELQDTVIDAPIETLAERLLQAIVDDARGLGAVLARASVERTGYARCRPVLGVQRWL